MQILKSPILHFILIGTLLFFIYEGLKPQNKELISITSQTIDAIVRQQAELQQQPVSEEQREQLIRSHIEDEILLKVAYDQGLDKNDFRVRKRMLGIVRSSLTEVVPEPTYNQLQAFYKENRSAYLSDTSWTFHQVFFNFNSKKIPENQEDFIHQISSSHNLEVLGDYSGFGGPRIKVSFNQLARSYGRQFAEEITKATLGAWNGPINSMLGIHYIKVTEIHAPEAPSFEQIENYIRQDYMFKKTREIQEDKINDLAKKFEIVVEGREVEL